MTSALDVDLSRLVGEFHDLLQREIDFLDAAASMERIGSIREALGTCVIDSFFAEALIVDWLARNRDGDDASMVG